MDTFNYVPSYSSQVESSENVLEMDFGDGYSQVAPDGINSKPLVFSILFRKISDSEVSAIVSFLDSQGNSKVFKWTPPAPYASEKMWRQKGGYRFSWDESNGNTVTATFVQVFSGA
jgi:phage-related protein